MIKRLRLPIFQAIALLTLSLGLISCESDSSKVGDAVDALPLRSAVIIKINQLEEFNVELQRSALFQELDTLSAVRGFETWVDQIPAYDNANPIWVAIHSSGADSYNLLFAQTSNGERNLPDNLEWTSKAYASTQIYTATSNDQEWHVASYKGVDILSKSPRLVEEAIRQMDSEYSLAQHGEFSKALKTTNRRDVANILVNYSELSGLLSSEFPNAPLNFIDNLGTWAAYDLSLDVDNWMFTGIHFNADSANSWLGCFNDIRPSDFDAQSLLPSSTAQAVMVNSGYSVKYQKNYQTYLERDDRLRLFTPQIDALGFDINEVLFSWAGGEFGLISLETSPDAIAQPRVAYISTEDAEEAMEAMDAQADPDFIENHRSYIIKKSAPKNLLLLGYGRIFKDMISPYYTVHGDYLLFGNNLLTLKGVINDLIDGRTLVNQSTFNEFVKEIPGSGHVRVLHKNPGALGLVRRLVDSDNTDEIDDYASELSRIAWSAVQYKVDGDVSYSQIYAKHEVEYIPEAKQLWALPLQGKVVGSPQLVLNHYSKRNEIVVQDESNALYLIDNGGEVIFKTVLDGPILGQITQVDLYRNGKLQLAFNTAKSLYMLDRNGNHVEGFPVQLPAAASAPVAVFDYDRARNYRFVIPCGNQVFNYDREAKQVEGWDFKPTETPVLRQPQHFTVGTRDFIVIREQNGKVHLVSRRGDTRIETEDLLPDTHNNLYLSVGKTQEETRIITLSESGELVSLFMNGRVDYTDIGLSSDPGEFLFADDKYIITQNGRLVVKDDLHPFTIDLDAELSTPLYFVRDEEPIVGVVIPELDQVWLYNESGDALPGLPLYGSSKFTIGEFGQRGVLNLIVGTEDGNLLNYKLE